MDIDYSYIYSFNALKAQRGFSDLIQISSAVNKILAHTVPAIMSPKILDLQETTLSQISPRGSLVLCSCIIVIVLLSNLLERWLLESLYQSLWHDLCLGQNERRRRSFTYFHLGITIMLILLVFGAYPVFDFLIGRAQVSSPLVGNVTYGDYMFTLSQIYSAYYLFEICFRTKFASAISIAHHIGLLTVIQTALGLFADPGKNPEAILEFYMCMVWGMYTRMPFKLSSFHPCRRYLYEWVYGQLNLISTLQLTFVFRDRVF